MQRQQENRMQQVPNGGAQSRWGALHLLPVSRDQSLQVHHRASWPQSGGLVAVVHDRFSGFAPKCAMSSQTGRPWWPFPSRSIRDSTTTGNATTTGNGAGTRSTFVVARPAGVAGRRCDAACGIVLTRRSVAAGVGGSGSPEAGPLGGGSSGGGPDDVCSPGSGRCRRAGHPRHPMARLGLWQPRGRER